MARRAIRQRSGGPVFENATDLDGHRLRQMCLEAMAEWRLDGVTVRVRYSRRADFSGTCYYQTRRIYVNLGRQLEYPYRMGTHLARTRSSATCWWKPVHTVELADAYQVVLFVFLHECFHFLVKRARRNPRQKESMCDRFAARLLVDRYGAVVRDDRGRSVARQEWDFQDLDRFVAAARRAGRTRLGRPPTPSPPAVRQAAGQQMPTSSVADPQLLLFPL